MKKLRIKREDQVKVISGEDKGKEGKVIKVSALNEKLMVEGVSINKRHTKPSASHPNGGIVEKESWIHISNVMLLDPKSGNMTKVGRKEIDGKLVRYSKKTGEEIK